MQELGLGLGLGMLFILLESWVQPQLGKHAHVRFHVRFRARFHVRFRVRSWVQPRLDKREGSC